MNTVVILMAFYPAWLSSDASAYEVMRFRDAGKCEEARAVFQSQRRGVNYRCIDGVAAR